MSVHTLSTVDPSTLLVDKNIRQARLTPEFVENVRMLGVLQPPIVHQDEDGLRVVMGHRRTLAAVEAGLTEIAVLIADTLEEADRLAQQVSENDGRTDLTDSERAAAFEQLALLGVTPAQIAKRSHSTTETVKKALAAKKSVAATAAMDAGRDFDQALALAEFDGDEAAIAQLEETIEEEPEQLAHTVQLLRDARTLAEKKAELAAPYLEKGMTVVERIGSDPNYHEALTLSSLVDAEGNHPGEEAADAVHVRMWHLGAEPHITFGIIEWEAKGFKSTYGMTGNMARGPMSEEQKEDRKTLIANNKAADAAETVRREWVTALLARKAAPKGWQRFLALANTTYHYTVRDRKSEIVADLLGLAEVTTSESRYPCLSRLDQHVNDHPARPEVVLIALACAGFEGDLRRDTWREKRPVAARFYLRQLAEWGYQLSAVEQIITSAEAEKDAGQE